MISRRQVLAAGTTTALAGTAGCTWLRQRTPLRREVAGRWEGDGDGPRRRGYAADVAGPRKSASLVWEDERPRAPTAGPVLADSRVYAAFEDMDSGLLEFDPDAVLVAFDAATGESRWRRPLDGEGEALSLLDGDLVVGGFSLARYPTDPDASAVWSTGGGFSCVAADDAAVYIADGYDHVRVVGPTDGNTVWETELGVPTTGVAGDGTAMYYGTVADELTAHGLSGERRWSVDLAGDVTATPVVVDGAVVTATVYGVLYARDAGSGRRQWRVPTDGPVYGTPAVDAETVYVADTGGTVRAVSLQDGERRWVRSLGDALDRGFRTGPVTDGESVYAVDVGGRCVALDATDGTTLWTVDVGGRPVDRPAIGEGHLYVGTVGGRLRAYEGER